MFNIRTLSKISSLGLANFDKDSFHVSREEARPDALLIRSDSLQEKEIGSQVKAIARAGAGFNNIPIAACTQRGIVVFNTPGANANSVKELVIAGLLLASRRIHEGMAWVEKQTADENLIPTVEKEKACFAGSEIAQKKLGVVGLGAVGVLVANTAINLDMEVYGYDPFLSLDAAWGLSRRVKRCENLPQLLGSCNFVSLHVPLNDKTHGFINIEQLKQAKKGLYLLNFARSALVESQAVKTALREGWLLRYITDFPIPELLAIKGVLSIPHLGASTREAENNCAIMAVRQLKDFLQQGNIRNSVNFPSCFLDSGGGTRLLVSNSNIPNMLSQILAVLNKEGLNIQDMVNHHREQIAYNIINLASTPLSPKTLAHIASIDGVIAVRQICPS